MGERKISQQRSISSLKNNNVNTLISNASTTLSTAFGFDLFSASVDFMKTWALFLIGAGLGVLNALMPFIGGIAVIYAIVYFLFRLFRFFRH